MLTLDSIRELYERVCLRGAVGRPTWLKELPAACGEREKYYPFFFELTAQFAPMTCLEIGTDKAVATAHLAAGQYLIERGEEVPLIGRVLTIDHNPDCQRFVKGLKARGLWNIEALTADSVSPEAIAEAQKLAPFDLIFIDGNHTYPQAFAEKQTYWPMLKEGGLMFFDDVGLVMATNEMEEFWKDLPEPKLRLDELHHTGFGVVQKVSG